MQVNAGSERHIVCEGMSHVRGDTRDPLLEHTIPQLMAETASTHPDKEAIIFNDTNIRWSWRQFCDEIDMLAAGLVALGLRKGDRLGIWSPNRIEWVLAQFATARIGVILVTINPAYRASELEHVLRASGCSALVMAPSFKTSNYIDIIRQLAPVERGCDSRRRKIEKLPDLKTIICMQDSNQSAVASGMLAFDDVAAMATPELVRQLDEISSNLDANDGINIQFTSGTTGLPKGATLTHRNILNNGKFTTDAMLFTELDRLCIPVPLYHCFGMVMGTLGCATKGAAMVFPGEGFDPQETIRTLAEEKCTALYGVPTMFNAILSLSDFEDYDLSSLRTGIMAGAPCPIETMNRVVSDMHMTDVTIAYGMTETSPVSFQSNVDDPLEKRVSTVGRVHPHVEIRIIDSNGDTSPIGQTGELCTRGYSIMKGYWGDEERTRDAIDAEGWLHSGDLAVFDEQGFCQIVGRVKDIIIRGGENVYPREVEDYIYRNTKVKDVQVFGIPDQKYGEQVCAWVVPKPGVSVTENEIIEFCKGQIAHYKVPVHVRIRDGLPMTVSGKAQKFKMRDAMAEELGLVRV